MKILNNSLSKHFTQPLRHHTLYLIKHTNLSQEIKNYFRNHVPKKWIQGSLFEIFLSNLLQISTFNQDIFNCNEEYIQADPQSGPVTIPFRVAYRNYVIYEMRMPEVAIPRWLMVAVWRRTYEQRISPLIAFIFNPPVSWKNRYVRSAFRTIRSA